MRSRAACYIARLLFNQIKTNSKKARHGLKKLKDIIIPLKATAICTKMCTSYTKSTLSHYLSSFYYPKVVFLPSKPVRQGLLSAYNKSVKKKILKYKSHFWKGENQRGI